MLHFGGYASQSQRVSFFVKDTYLESGIQTCGDNCISSLSPVHKHSNLDNMALLNAITGPK
jgi:hypothetical protein